MLPTLCPPLHKLACVCPIPVPVGPAAVVNQCQQKQISCPRSSRNIEDGHPALELRKRSYREAARSKETPVNKGINKAINNDSGDTRRRLRTYKPSQQRQHGADPEVAGEDLRLFGCVAGFWFSQTR